MGTQFVGEIDLHQLPAAQALGLLDAVVERQEQEVPLVQLQGMVLLLPGRQVDRWGQAVRVNQLLHAVALLGHALSQHGVVVQDDVLLRSAHGEAHINL